MSSHRLPKDLAIAPYAVEDPGSGVAIVVDRWNQHVPLAIGSGVETNTLGDPTQAGQRLCLFAQSSGGGSRAVTASSAVNAAGNTVMTFSTVDGLAVLESFSVGSGAYEWRIVATDGTVALS